MGRLVRETCDFLVSIPMKGRISSLNASAAAAILLYEAVRRDRSGRTDGETMSRLSDEEKLSETAQLLQGVEPTEEYSLEDILAEFGQGAAEPAPEPAPKPEPTPAPEPDPDIPPEPDPANPPEPQPPAEEEPGAARQARTAGAGRSPGRA